MTTINDYDFPGSWLTTFGMPKNLMPQPFLKWPGGKRAIMPQIAQYFPDQFNYYWEPFLGAGAPFFHLLPRITHAELSDSNQQLIETYHAVRDNLTETCHELGQHASHHHQPDYYYQVRDRLKPTTPAQAAARLIYLNRTCFNGLYRVNHQGRFNVPRGSYNNPTINQPVNLARVSLSLKNQTVVHQDFADIRPQPGDLVYCDPPYDLTFDQYTTAGFKVQDLLRLRNAALAWHRNGAYIVISNSDTQSVREAFSGPDFTIHTITAPRHVSRNASGRSPTDELIITATPHKETP